MTTRSTPRPTPLLGEEPLRVVLEAEADATAYRLAAIVEGTQDAVIGTTTEGLVTSWNRAAERMLGYRADEVIGRPVSMIWPEGSLAPSRTFTRG